MSSITEGSGIGGLDTCTPICGDGIRHLWHSAEQCDDNGTAAGDGCGATCQIEAGFACSGGSITSKDTCASVCGDGLRVGDEACDDGNTVSLEGCSGDCVSIEDGYTCAGGSSTSADACVPCHTSCAKCSGTSSTECTTCAAATPFFSQDSQGASCLASCTPTGKYANATSGLCEPCEATCGTCTGPARTDCLTCTSDATPLLHNGACVDACPDNGTFVEVVGSQGTCVTCHASCETCSGAVSSSCLTCPSTGTMYYDDGACESACPAGKYPDASNTCQACDVSCATCSAGVATSCTSCLPGGELDPSAGTCTTVCPLSMFLVVESGQPDGCVNCNSTCQTCLGSSTNCTSCKTESELPILHESTCMAVGGFRPQPRSALWGCYPQSLGHPILTPLYLLLWHGHMNYLSDWCDPMVRDLVSVLCILGSRIERYI